MDKSEKAFKEAPLDLSDEFNHEFGPGDSPIVLVSAAGAVGKTTLAREIAYRTGAIYLDLAQSEPVGGHTFTGSLVNSYLYERWKDQSISVLIDGLDEARLRATPEAFEAFLYDIYRCSIDRRLPTVLFGRSVSVQDTWLILSEKLEVPVLEIGYFGPKASIEFAEAKLRAVNPSSSHLDTGCKAIRLLLEGIRSQTKEDGDRFAGYAPVLQAVVERVGKESNLAALIAKIEKGVQPITLQQVAFEILERERSKLDRSIFENHDIADRLYLADEQLNHLAARVYGTSPPDLPVMSPHDAQIYENVLPNWVAEHPFLVDQDCPSSAVFDAVIATWALRKGISNEVKEAAVKREVSRGFTANPFLSEIYMNEIAEGPDRFLPSEHIGIIYSSLRARLSLSDSADLLIEITDEGSDGDLIQGEQAEVEITHSRRGIEQPRVFKFRTEPDGMIRLGNHIDDVEITAPLSHVEIGPSTDPSNEVKFVAPISIQCDILSINTKRVIVEPPLIKSVSSVFLEANEFDGPMMTSVPVLRGQTTLAAFWPNVRNHPWTSFAVKPTSTEDSRIDEALRRFRKFVISFRSHGKGSLARFERKIEHERMTKGVGQAVLNLMLKENILHKKNSMYFLASDLLAKQTGVNYTDCMTRQFGPQAVEFVRKALN